MTSTAHLASSERAARLCEMCLLELVYPPNVFCSACVDYMRDCEAEVSEGQ